MLALLLSLFAGLGVVGIAGSGGSKASAAPTDGTSGSSSAPVLGEDEDAYLVSNEDEGKDRDGHDNQADDQRDSHDDHDDQVDDQSGSHDDHDDQASSIDLPTTQEEINAFVAMVRAGDETHVHGSDSSLLAEHTALLDLVPPAEATHIAIGHGSWFDPDNWHNGEVPDDGAKVVIPDGVQMLYDEESDARLFTVRVDGELDFATDTDSKMVVDTFVVSPTGSLVIGTEENPVEADVNVDIVIANNGDIDVDWDPNLLSRGLISHGKTEIYGMEKDSHEKVTDDPMAGDNSITFDGIPEGWQVGDEIVIAGTDYEGYKWDNDLQKVRYYEPEDEVRIITDIIGNEIFFEDALEYDHDTPRDDLHTSVANYSRNVTVRSEDGTDSLTHERGHVMLMHSDDVDVRYAAFEDLGRTAKWKLAQEADDYDILASDSNVSGRYALHLHRLGTDDVDNPAIIIGNAVSGSPGWGFVHHDSNAVLDNNASYDTFGAGFVSETGNEIGIWNDNIAIDAQGRSGGDPKVQIKPDVELPEFDTGVSGDGFWFQSRMVESTNNVAASVNHGFVYFHRGPISGDDSDRQLNHDADNTPLPEAFFYNDDIRPDESPILSFDGNEAFAAKQGLHVVKASPQQGHDVHSVLENFTAWSVTTGAHLEYTAHYSLINFDLIGKEDAPFNDAQYGISFSNNVSDIAIIDSDISNFKYGINLHKGFVDLLHGAHAHEYFIAGTDVSDNENLFLNYDPDLDTILASSDTGPYEVTLELDEPLFYSTDDPYLSIRGTKTDGLGETGFASGTDDVRIWQTDLINLMENAGYYSADDGANYLVLDLYFTDRLTGELYKQPEKIELDPDIFAKLEFSPFRDAVFNGDITIAELDKLTSESPELVEIEFSGAEALAALESGDDVWNALTDGHGTHSEDLEDETEDDDHAQHDMNHM